ncbi:MAG: hypothetical protein GY950_29380, partial [bacterium]|nr:hypothetical protein [bacterium]
MNSEKVPAPHNRVPAPQGDKTFVFTDFHGDLDIMARSFADKGLMAYDGNLETLIKAINVHIPDKHAHVLERSILRQAKPVRLFFLGDCLDRYTYGFHIIQFFSKIRWERFNIFPVFLLGNHDLLNFFFLSNPYKFYRVYHGNGPSYSRVSEYIRSMGMDLSLKGFVQLHGQEILELQKQFYREGRLEFSFPGSATTVTLTYQRDYSFMDKLGLTDADKEWECIGRFRDILVKAGIEVEEDHDKEKDDEKAYNSWHPKGSFVDCMLTGLLPLDGGTDWWSIRPGRDDMEGADGRVYYGPLEDANIMRRKTGDNQVEILPVDWRVIAMVWRKHYGDYFRRARYIVLEGSTIYVHGGVSVLSMMDPLVFGNLYFPLAGEFREPTKFMDLGSQVERSNRLVSQVLKNGLNDCSFEDMSGAEVVDLMGYWRGSHAGFPQFGGPLWSDFEYLEYCMGTRDTRDGLLNYYRKFSEAYGIKRIVCGHTPFYSFGDEPGPRLKRSRVLQDEIGLEYICVDNGCSRAYRRDKPVVNGI